jgi:sugar phosphate permease
MGIVDGLMLSFLGLGHFLHAFYPTKKPVLSLWIGMILCGINYSLIPLTLTIKPLANIYILSLYMCINGFLQSFTWPNLLMIINFNFNPDKYAVLLGFWAANANVGNIVGYAVFWALNAGG